MFPKELDVLEGETVSIPFPYEKVSRDAISLIRSSPDNRVIIEDYQHSLEVVKHGESTKVQLK